MSDPETGPDRPRLRRLATGDLTPAEIAAIRHLLERAFGSEEEERFTDEDWDHAVGGTHFVLELRGQIIAHASVVERELHVDGQPLRTGYVEAVATDPDRHGTGFGSLLVADVTAWIRERFELGGLGSGRQRFYARQSWLSWAGPSFVRTSDGPRRTPEEDGYIMVLLTPSSPPLDLTGAITCEWRSGDVW